MQLKLVVMKSNMYYLDIVLIFYGFIKSLCAVNDMFVNIVYEYQFYLLQGYTFLMFGLVIHVNYGGTSLFCLVRIMSTYPTANCFRE